VGKTYTALREARNLAAEGKDVVIAFVETHGRAGTAAMAEGLEQVPRARVEYRGSAAWEMDLDAVLARAPEVALVDELAHHNHGSDGGPSGRAREKRWQDVEALLTAGIDVLSTVNIQHIDSLNDVVEQITGVPQRETVPDSFLRSADQIEVVDLAPDALRSRLSAGLVYPAERIDAALSNYFRLGNLTALRELALIWLADEVDQALQGYRAEHGIEGRWEARERVVVALTGGEEGETLLRRGARIAARSSGGDLLAVHVTSQDGLRSADPAALARQRALVEKLGGTFHQVIGEEVPAALVGFAKSVDATQLVLGVSRRGRAAAALTGPGIGATVIRDSGDIDVHIVTHAAAGGRFSLPRLTGGLTARRRIAGLVLALVGGPLLTWLLTPVRAPETMTSDVLAYQLLVVLVAITGGMWPALLAAFLSALSLDYFFIEPIHEVTIGQPFHILALALYVTIAVLVSFVVDRAERFTRAAKRSAAESELVQNVAGSVLRGDDAVQALVDRTREAFRLDSVVLEENGTPRASAGERPAGAEPEAGRDECRVPVDAGAVLELRGGELTAPDRRLLAVVAAQLAAALEHQRLTAAADEMAPIAASDRVRGALLSALSHDLRRPLAAATAAVGGLRATDGILGADDRHELVDTAEESLAALSALLTDLLDVSRIQSGALLHTAVPTDPGDVLVAALDELGLGPGRVHLGIGHGDATAVADPVLLRRTVVNLLANADRFAPAGQAVSVTTSVFGGRVEIRIIDHGPGIARGAAEDIFVPFQRLGDTDNTTGLGLGLALSRGFVESMGGTLLPEDTPGGGLTMVVSLPAGAAATKGGRG